MKHIFKIFALLGVIAFSGMIFGCVEDESAYLPQDKEDVEIDKPEEGHGGDSTILKPGELQPGIHLVELMADQGDGTLMQRKFKYYMPISINSANPISLIFDFHGSTDFKGDPERASAISNIRESHSLNQHAINENCIIVFPEGEIIQKDEEGGTINWQNSEKHLAFVDSMLYFFKKSSPQIDIERIYSTGHSSGAIFSFYLAYHRSTDFAAIAPRAGQMKLTLPLENKPERAVPIRVFAGEIDDIVNHNALIANTSDWAREIGGYYDVDMVHDEEGFDIDAYKHVETRSWEGSYASYEIFSLIEEGHGVDLTKCLPYIWSFFQENTLSGKGEFAFISTEEKEVELFPSHQKEVNLKYNDGSIPSIEGIPDDWNVELKKNSISIQAPADFYGSSTHEATLVVWAHKGDLMDSVHINLTLKEPIRYFRVGDPYFNETGEFEGIVFWVSPESHLEAKIVGQAEHPKSRVTFGDLSNFITPSREDGASNTMRSYNYIQDNNLELSADNSAVVWAHEYGTSGEWYLPAVDEYHDMGNNLTKINETLKKYKGTQIITNTYLSSTVDMVDDVKKFAMFSFATNRDWFQENKGNSAPGYVRVIKPVSIVK